MARATATAGNHGALGPVQAAILALRAVPALVLGLVLTLVVPLFALGEEIDARPPVDSSADPVKLESLLKLPPGFGTTIDTRQGATRLQWRSKFAQGRAELAEAEQNLARTQKELDSASESSSSWQVSAPGAATPEASPLNLRLRNQVKEQRTEIVEATRRLRSLSLEADLAAVPEEWRE